MSLFVPENHIWHEFKTGICGEKQVICTFFIKIMGFFGWGRDHHPISIYCFP
jgi:hypothetical protein